MTKQFFPAIYYAADNAAVTFQRQLLLAHKVNVWLLVAGAILAGLIPPSVGTAIVSALLFLGSLVVFVAIRVCEYQRRWYQARALAESIKTLTWRLAMRSEPFNSGSESDVFEKYRARLLESLTQNRELGSSLSGDWSREEQVPSEVLSLRSSSLEERKLTYLSERIDEQRTWYTHKAAQSSKTSNAFTWAVGTTYTIAVLLVLVRIANPSIPYALVSICAIVASSLIGWSQLRRFDELASAYSLTAHEVGIVKSRVVGIDRDDQFSNFVSDAENAFSREHTQWAARQSH